MLKKIDKRKKTERRIVERIKGERQKERKEIDNRNNRYSQTR
jgi:hypothetical protein